MLIGLTGFVGIYLSRNFNLIKRLSYNLKENDQVEWNKLHGVIHCASLAYSHNENLKEPYYLANVQLTKILIIHFVFALGQNNIDELLEY